MRIARAALLFSCLAVAGGCGTAPPPPTPIPVKGKVVFTDGKPVKGMVLTFHPDDEATKLARLQSAPLPDDGSFSFECLPGRYKATLGAIPKSAGAAADGPGTAPPPIAPAAPVGTSTDTKAAVLARHADALRTPLTAEVPAGGTSDLVLTVK